MEELKKFQKNAFTLVGTGVGLGVLSGLDNAPDLSHMTKGIGTLSSLTVMGTTLDIMKKKFGGLK